MKEEVKVSTVLVGGELSGAEGRLGCQWDAEIASFSFMIFFMWLGLDFKTNEV